MLRHVAASIWLIGRGSRVLAVALVLATTGGAWGLLAATPAGAATPNGGSMGIAALQPEPAHWVDTPRPRLAGPTGAEVSNNWAGQLATGATFTSVGAQWTVPSVQLSPSAEYSLTAIGIDGTSDSLIQAGTEQDSDGGSTTYGAWYELYPAAPVPIGGVVEPGDTMVASITENTPGTWTVTLEDSTGSTKNWGVSVTLSYSGPATSAEWIEEAPSVEGTQSTLADFGSTRFSDLELDGSVPSAGMLDPVYMAGASGALVAYPGTYDASAGAFPVTYGTPPPDVTSISPPEGTTSGGTKVTIVGDFLGAVASVDFGALPAPFAQNADGTITAVAPPEAAGTVDVTVNVSGTSSTASSADRFTYATSLAQGYWLVGGDGGIFSFGAAPFFGSTGAMSLQRPVVGITATADRAGYWLVATDGGIFAFGDSGFFGSIPGLGIGPAGSTAPRHLAAPIVGMVPSADGGGYFMVAADGGVFAFGDASFAGSCPGIGGCSGQAVAVMPDATGNGYWLVTTTGHVYSFGDAATFGAPGPQGVPVTSAVRAPDGRGYWILFANGAVAGYGDAGNLGSPLGLLGSHDPATAIFATVDGAGYWVTAADGAVYPFGDATGEGSMAGKHLNASIVAGTGW